MSRLYTEDFYSSKPSMYDTRRVDIYHYVFIHTQRMYSTKNESDVNHGLWVIMICHVGSSIVTNVLLCREMIMGEIMHELAQGINGKSLYFPPQFFCEPKLLKKIRSIIFLKQQTKVRKFSNLMKIKTWETLKANWFPKWKDIKKTIRRYTLIMLLKTNDKDKIIF